MDDDYAIEYPPDSDLLGADPKRDDEIARESLQSAAEQGTKHLADQGLEALGPLSVAPARPGRSLLMGGHLRSPPLAGFGGIEFRFDVPRDSAAHPYCRAIDANQLSRRAREFIEAREEICELVGLLHSENRSLRHHFEAGEGAARLVGLGMSAKIGEHFNFYADLERLGPNHRRGVDRVWAIDPHGLSLKLLLALGDHETHVNNAQALRKMNAIGWITEDALRAIDLSRLSRAFEFLELAGKLCFRFTSGEGRGVRAHLAWSYGRLEAYLDGHGWWSGRSTLCIQNCNLPATALDGSIGLPVRRLVDVPIISGDALIKDAENTPGGLFITLGVLAAPVHMTTGKIGAFVPRPWGALPQKKRRIV